MSGHQRRWKGNRKLQASGARDPRHSGVDRSFGRQPSRNGKAPPRRLMFPLSCGGVVPVPSWNSTLWTKRCNQKIAGELTNAGTLRFTVPGNIEDLDPVVR